MLNLNKDFLLQKDNLQCVQFRKAKLHDDVNIFTSGWKVANWFCHRLLTTILCRRKHMVTNYKTPRPTDKEFVGRHLCLVFFWIIKINLINYLHNCRLKEGNQEKMLMEIKVFFSYQSSDDRFCKGSSPTSVTPEYQMKQALRTRPCVLRIF